MGKINYKNTKPTIATIDGIVYRFRSMSEFYFAVFIWCKIKQVNPNKHDKKIVGFTYEQTLISFDVPKRNKVKAYRPDFSIKYDDGTSLCVEIKGRMDNRSRVKIALFKQQVGEIRVILTNSDEFMRIKAIAEKALSNTKVKKFIQWRTQ